MVVTRASKRLSAVAHEPQAAATTRGRSRNVPPPTRKSRRQRGKPAPKVSAVAAAAKQKSRAPPSTTPKVPVRRSTRKRKIKRPGGLSSDEDEPAESAARKAKTGTRSAATKRPAARLNAAARAKGAGKPNKKKQATVATRAHSKKEQSTTPAVRSTRRRLGITRRRAQEGDSPTSSAGLKRPFKPPKLLKPPARGSDGESDKFEVCRHIKESAAINTEKVSNHIRRPKTWKCQAEEGCDVVVDNLWICLRCGFVACGRNTPRQHALAHFKATKHPLAICLSRGECHCYVCDDWVVGDSQYTDLKLFRQMLASIQRNETMASTTRSGKVRVPAAPIVGTKALERKASFFTKAEQEKAELRDRAYTIVARWNLFRISQSFNRWRSLTAQLRGINKSSTTSPATTKPDAQKPRSAVSRQPAERADSERHPTPSTADDATGAPPKLVATAPAEKRSKSTPAVTTQVKSTTVARPKPKIASSGKKKGTRRQPARRVFQPGSTGMRNLGNTCYFNAVIQVLSNTRVFSEFFKVIIPETEHRRNQVREHDGSELSAAQPYCGDCLIACRKERKANCRP